VTPLIKKVGDPLNYVIVILTTALIVFAGALVIEAWRTNWRLPLAGFLLGTVAGLSSYLFEAGPWSVIWTLIGAIVGPNFIVALEGSAGIKKLADSLLERWSDSGGKK
jgi:hypothetical protein